MYIGTNWKFVEPVLTLALLATGIYLLVSDPAISSKIVGALLVALGIIVALIALDGRKQRR